MKSCDIHIQTIDPEGLGDLGLRCSVTVKDADIADKLMLMHTMAVNLHLDKMDLLMYVKAEIENIFDEGATIITIPKGLEHEG